MNLHATPAWALTAFYALHMLSTVVWIGGLSALVILVLPVAQRVLDLKTYAAFVENIQRRFDPLSWFCLILLGGTGLFQMSANPNYHGFLAITNRWAVAILLKHGVFLGMIAVNAYISGWVLPGLRRAALRLAKKREGEQAQAISAEKPSSEMAQLQRMNAALLRLNLVLAVLILALTALARAS